MKKNILLLTLIIFGFGCSGPKPAAGTVVEEDLADQIEGVWRLTEVTMTSPDTTIVTTEFEHPSYKILSGDRWAFGHQADDSTIMAGGGTFTFDGESYTENIEYHSVSGVVGQSITFDIDLDSTTWHHVGTITIDGEETVLDEVWERAD